jgi:hypothetical protein
MGGGLCLASDGVLMAAGRRLGLADGLPQPVSGGGVQAALGALVGQARFGVRDAVPDVGDTLARAVRVAGLGLLDDRVAQPVGPLGRHALELATRLGDVELCALHALARARDLLAEVKLAGAVLFHASEGAPRLGAGHVALMLAQPPDVLFVASLGKVQALGRDLDLLRRAALGAQVVERLLPGLDLFGGAADVAAGGAG